MKAVKGSASLKMPTLMKIWEGPTSDMEKVAGLKIRQTYPSQLHDDHRQSKSLFAILRERTGPNYSVESTASSGELNDLRIFIHYIMWKWVMNLWEQMCNSWTFGNSIEKLIVEENSMPEQTFSMDEILRNRISERTSSMRRPSQCQVSGIWRTG